MADRYGGTLADVLRLAIPPRHAAISHFHRTPASTPARPRMRRPHVLIESRRALPTEQRASKLFKPAGPWARYSTRSGIHRRAGGRPQSTGHMVSLAGSGPGPRRSRRGRHGGERPQRARLSCLTGQPRRLKPRWPSYSGPSCFISRCSAGSGRAVPALACRAARPCQGRGGNSLCDVRSGGGSRAGGPLG